MLQPIYLQDYKVESEQGNVNYSVVGALPNEMPGVDTKQYTWNLVSHMILEKCSRLIRIKYDFKDTEFQKEITFEDKLMGTLQLGSKVYNAGDIMTYRYDKELLEMDLTILFPIDEKICGKDLSWNIFINDTVSCSPYTTSFSYSENFLNNIDWNWSSYSLTVNGNSRDYSSYTFTITDVPPFINNIIPNTGNLKQNKCGIKPSVTVNISYSSS